MASRLFQIHRSVWRKGPDLGIRTGFIENAQPSAAYSLRSEPMAEGRVEVGPNGKSTLLGLPRRASKKRRADTSYTTIHIDVQP